MAQFMFFIRSEGADFSKYSAGDFQDLLKRYQAWTEKLKTEGRFLAGEKLSNDRGKSLKSKGGQIIVDGPYADTKEAIGGFYIIEAKDLNEAVEIGKSCPSLTDGGSVEIREVDQM
ncbi:MAG TPA: YciI family protein [Chthoniobacterales bacterium]|jgi:hypothetical protein|nr:YciI family protein [Chthoniobacterales bacterium]